MLQAYQEYYQQILTDQSVPSLLQPQFQDYGQPNYSSQKQIFPLCNQTDTPEFFKTNLLSPNRIIKYLNGEYCVYRAFYFQLFKLMFEIQNDQKDYLEMFKEIIFDPNIIQRNGQNSRAKRENSRLKSNGQQQNQSDSSRLSELSEQQAFKRQFQIHQKCIAQFTEKVLENKMNFSSFEHYLPFYPQIDQSMVLILETFIENANENQEQEMDSIQSILEYLSEIFEIQLVVIENCFKFEQSDVFLYIEQKQDDQVWVYIAFNEILDDQDEDPVQENHGQGYNQAYQNQPSAISQNHLQHKNQYHNQPPTSSYQSYQQQHQFSSPHQIQELSSANQIQRRQSSHNSYASSSNQNPSIKDNQSLSQRDKKSSSYRDNVITSEMKAQQSNHKYMNSHYSPNNHFVNKSPNQFYQKEENMQGNRPNRISSDMGVSQQNSHRPQSQNPLTKSNHLPSNYQNPHNNKYNTIEDLPNNTSTSYIWNQNHQNPNNQKSQLSQQQSAHQLPSALSQSNSFLQNSKKQGRNFHKKVRYFDEDSIIEQKTPRNKQLTKMQSITQSYRQDNFHHQPQKDRESYVKKPQHQSSFHVIQNSYNPNTTDRKVTDSKAETIINMFGDMLGSCANINTFDAVHGSSSSIANGFGSSSHHKMQAQQDNNNPYRNSYSKKINYAYGTSNNIFVPSGIDSNNVNMKKTKSQQVILEAKPQQNTTDVFTKVQIQYNNYTNMNQQISKPSFKSSIDRISGTSHEQNNNNKILMDSQELRNNGNVLINNNIRKSNNEYYPFRNINMGQSSNNQHNNTRRQEWKQSPQNSDKQYIENLQAKSFWGEQGQSNREKSNRGSFHNSSRGSAKSHHTQHQNSKQPPNIKVNSIKSESETSSRQMNKRNNYYKEEDFAQLEFDNNSKNRGKEVERDLSIRSEQNLRHNQNSNLEQNNYHQTKYKREQGPPKPTNSHKLLQLAHQYKSQEYVTIPLRQQPSNYKHQTYTSRAYTSNNQSQPFQAQNTEQQDFFFHPSNKSSIKYGLKTIEQVRASKQTNKDSYKIGNASKITHDMLVNPREDNLRNYELVNSITGLQKDIISNSTKQITAQLKGNKGTIKQILSTDTFKFKESQNQSKELNDQSVNNGTFYKQFTNSKVLKLLKQPYKTKVQILKNRFKGQHRISINKLLT